jgi:hypothetical protein
MHDLVTLPLHCGACGCLAAVEIVRYSLSIELFVQQTWDCPDCRQPNKMKFDGEILRVGRGPADPDRLTTRV